MAHFAITSISTGEVQEVIVIDNRDLPAYGSFPQAEQAGRELIINWGIMPAGHTAYQCSYSGSFRNAYPGQGWTYNAERDEFVAPIFVNLPVPPIPQES